MCNRESALPFKSGWSWAVLAYRADGVGGHLGGETPFSGYGTGDVAEQWNYFIATDFRGCDFGVLLR